MIDGILILGLLAAIALWLCALRAQRALARSADLQHEELISRLEDLAENHTRSSK